MWNLDSSLGYLIIRTARSMKRALDARLVEHSLTSSQYIVLVRLWEEDGIPITELGERLHLDNPTLTGIVDRLERDGLLQRRRNHNDRRIVNVYLTAKGRALQQSIDSPAEAIDNEAWEELDTGERKDLLDRLKTIRKKMDEILD